MKILDRLPIPMTETLAFVREEYVRLKEAEIIVWVSLSVKLAPRWNPMVPRFPAILDTGHTHNLAIQHQHLLRWAGLRPEMLRRLGYLRHAGRMPLHAANVWLHLNEPGTMTVSSKEPFFLNLPGGIAVYPDGANYPRLPLLGLRAILSNKLHFAVDGEKNLAHLRTPDWRTRLLQWLA